MLARTTPRVTTLPGAACASASGQRAGGAAPSRATMRSPGFRPAEVARGRRRPWRRRAARRRRARRRSRRRCCGGDSLHASVEADGGQRFGDAGGLVAAARPVEQLGCRRRAPAHRRRGPAARCRWAPRRRRARLRRGGAQDVVERRGGRRSPRASRLDGQRHQVAARVVGVPVVLAVVGRLPGQLRGLLDDPPCRAAMKARSASSPTCSR